MNDTLYQLMNWPEIEAIVYSEHDKPGQILGARVVDAGVLVQCFFPDATLVKVVAGKKEYQMEQVDPAGFFACIIPGKKVPKYNYEVNYADGTKLTPADPYAFENTISAEELELFTKGINYKVYEMLGAHEMTVNGVKGVRFAVWAPCAIRVSLVGDFNNWDGRIYPMHRDSASGVFELFVPGLKAGAVYKYEIKSRGSLTYCKADPYANAAELRPNTASIVADLSSYEWKDAEWMKKRAKTDLDKEPMFVYEVHAGSFKKPTEENGSFYNYREMAVIIADHVKKMGYTHIELLPVMEHPFDGSWGYQVTGYYAPTARYGTPEDFMYFMDYMHKQGIGVILDWVPAHFPKDAFGLSNFDGTCLYEHRDKRQGEHPHWGTLIFNYGRPQVKNFLIGSALYWADKFHADGIRMDAVASMLYLDYGREDGEWVANVYGGNENLEAIEFIKHLNSIFKQREDGAVLIAEESTAWPKISGDLNDGGLGFDFKWNMGWMNDFTEYMKQDPLFRKGCHGALTFSMMYAYSEKFILALSHDEVVHGKASLINKMPGSKEEKLANLRLAYGYMITHPGKKLLFMGQDFGQEREWSEERSLDWFLLNDPKHAELLKYMQELMKLYKKYPALFAKDFLPEGFEWMSCQDADHSMISFVRRGEEGDKDLYVVCNFTPVVYNDKPMGVPFAGKYKEIFNSDATEFGGSGVVNAKQLTSKPVAIDGRENSINMNIPPLGIAIFTCTPATEKKEEAPAKATKKEAVKEVVVEKTAEAKPAKKPAAKKTTAKKPAEVKKTTETKPATKKATTKKTK